VTTRKVLYADFNTTKPLATYRFGGRPPPAEMVPGNYPLVCTSARIARKGNKLNVVLVHEVCAGSMSGVELIQWLALPEKGKPITHRMDVWLHFQLVLGRPPLANEFDEQVFVQKSFLGYVGFSQKDPINKQTDMTYAQRKKGERDFLRVQMLLELLP
jgi:hypothetical protein